MKLSPSSYTLRRLVAGLVISTIAFIGLLSLEAHFRPMATQGLYFQQWSSETMMQTVSIEDLSNEPMQSLWYLHIQPPAFDTLRAILACVVNSDNATVTLWRVDRCLYYLWAVVYGMSIFIVFWWISDITSIVFAAGAALLFSAHPALIFYATLLETTLLSAFLVLCFSYLLWRIREGRSVSALLLAISFLTLYFTRSVFQWHWLLLLPLCLMLLRYPRRSMLLFFTITFCVVSLYTVKQMSLFGISSTSSFTGLNLANSIGVADAWEYYRHTTAPDGATFSVSPSVLSRVKKINGALNFNNSHYLEVNHRLQDKYHRQLLSTPLRTLAGNVLSNLRIYLLPSSRYTPHLIVDRIPWRSEYDIMMSFPILLSLIHI